MQYRELRFGGLLFGNLVFYYFILITEDCLFGHWMKLSIRNANWMKLDGNPDEMGTSRLVGSSFRKRTTSRAH